MNPFLSYLATAFIVLVVVPAFLHFAFSPDLGDLGPFLVIFMIAFFIFSLLGALPTLLAWLPLYHLTDVTGLPRRTRAMLAAGPSAAFGAWCVNGLLEQMFNGPSFKMGLGQGTFIFIACIAVLVSFAIWTWRPVRDGE